MELSSFPSFPAKGFLQVESSCTYPLNEQPGVRASWGGLTHCTGAAAAGAGPPEITPRLPGLPDATACRVASTPLGGQTLAALPGSSPDHCSVLRESQSPANLLIMCSCFRQRKLSKKRGLVPVTCCSPVESGLFGIKSQQTLLSTQSFIAN